jgi:hypothetical protein
MLAIRSWWASVCLLAACASSAKGGASGDLTDGGGSSDGSSGDETGSSSDGSSGDETGSSSDGSSGGETGSRSSDGSGSGSSGSSSGGTGTVPTLGGCGILPADNPWNTRIDDTAAYPVHPSSATYMAHMSPTTHLHPDWGNWSTDHYGIPWQTVAASQAMVPMTFDTADQSDPGPYPFPADARVEGGSNSGGDMHVLVIEEGTCALYETWNSTYLAPGWHAGSGARFDLTSNALRPDGWTSADAAGLPILPGLVKVAEVKAGAVEHALRFTMARSQQAYIHPATHAAGEASALLPPMGLRLRLKASFDLSGFGGPSLVVLTAMKQYGIILADNGSDWYVSGDSDDAWTNLMDQMVSDLDKVVGSDFEVVQTGPLSTAGL